MKEQLQKLIGDFDSKIMLRKRLKEDPGTTKADKEYYTGQMISYIYAKQQVELLIDRNF